jgi:transposase
MAARARERTPEYRELYRRRAGVEATISQGTRAFGLRRSRYVGILKTHLQHVITATAMNFVRLADWLAGAPMARTREPAFVRVLRQAAAA